MFEKRSKSFAMSDGEQFPPLSTFMAGATLRIFKARAELDIEFAQAVRPERYKLFQLADMVATLKLVELKLEHGDMMTESEYKFFGGPRNFKRNYLRFVKGKEI